MSKPNVILCTCDELQSFALGCYGNPVVKTPNMDRLAKEGVQFYTGVTNSPGCVAARSCMMTGQYTRTCTGTPLNEAYDPPERTRTRLVDPTLPEMFKSAGYRTALRGKWHVHPDPLLVGFDSAIYPTEAQRQYGQVYRRNHEPKFAVEEFAPFWEVDRSLDFVHEEDHRPFFLYHNISIPHMPIGPGNAPEGYVNMYSPDEIPWRENVRFDGDGNYGKYNFKVYTIWDYWERIAWHKQPEKKTDKMDKNLDFRKLAAYYYGMVTCADDALGRLIEGIEKAGVAENTIIVFTADHGDQMGSHGLLHKDKLYEESIRVPMLYCWQGRLNQRAIEQETATLIDIMPTLLDLCDIECPDSVQGKSLCPFLAGQSPVDKDGFAFVETSNMIGIRTPDYLHGIGYDYERRQPTGETEWFFDLRVDPYQMHNLAGEAKYSEQCNRLRSRLLEWDKTTPWLKDG